jgi:Restriction endonuclease
VPPPASEAWPPGSDLARPYRYMLPSVFERLHKETKKDWAESRGLVDDLVAVDDLPRPLGLEDLPRRPGSRFFPGRACPERLPHDSKPSVFSRAIQGDSGLVGLESAHALTGVMADHNATGGVLVTTSWLGRASEQFAQRNHITLKRLRASDNVQTGRPGPAQS